MFDDFDYPLFVLLIVWGAMSIVGWEIIGWLVG